MVPLSAIWLLSRIPIFLSKCDSLIKISKVCLSFPTPYCTYQLFGLISVGSSLVWIVLIYMRLQEYIQIMEYLYLWSLYTGNWRE